MSDPKTRPGGEDEDLFAFGDSNIDTSHEFSDELEAELDQALEHTQPEFELPDDLANPFDYDSYTADGPEVGDHGLGEQTPASTAPAGALPGGQPAPQVAGARATTTVLASSRTQLVLGLMVAVNLLLVGLSWRSQGSTEELIRSLRIESPQTPTSDAYPITDRFSTLDLPISEPRAEGYETLEEAQRSIERGEFRAAREMLFALLAVIDRVENTARYDVEARAAFLIGDTYRFEADAVALAVAADSGEGGQL